MKKIQVYILCHNRPQYVSDAVSSVLSNNGDDYELIISDNSTNDSVFRVVKSAYPNVKYIRRRPALSALNHFQVIISEASCKYLVMLHDDDRVRANYLKEMAITLDQDPIASAVACNGEVIRPSGELTGHKFIGLKEDKAITSANELIAPYISIAISGAPPFPSYMYRAKALNAGMMCDSGKHSDVLFLLNVLEQGRFIWTSKPLFEYRVHSTNDSQAISMHDVLSLERYLRDLTKDDSSMDYTFFKYRYWFAWFVRSRSQGSLYLRRVVGWHLFCTTFKYLSTSLNYWIYLTRRIFRRF